MVDYSQIFQATYSGVPVYEMICKGVAVMRRKSDSYLNATQILKVADFDKPQRTRILEREVQIGQHEKVQGGYGKYQGTWVPYERGKALAELYGVDKVLAPILEFVKGDQSPPLAPKHATAATAKPRKPRETRVRKRVKPLEDEFTSDIETHASTDDVPAKRPRTRPSGLREKPPKSRKSELLSEDEHVSEKLFAQEEQQQQQQQEEEDNDMEEEEEEEEEEMRKDHLEPDSEKTFAQRLLNYFMSEKTSIPALIARPPKDMDINVIIDDEGHTSLHWAAAMARIKAVKLLIENGADIYRVNYKGQTALMRSVLFTNNFDLKTFDSLLDLLRTTIFNIDKRDQTVFHHTAAMSDWKGKIYASRYYMECLINKLKHNQSELISILNVQDTHGDTALTIAAKIGNRRLIKLLIDAGASTEIVNEEGMTPRDYYTDMEKSVVTRPTPPIPSSSPSEDTGSMMNESDTREVLRARVEAMFKNVTHDTPSISKVFDDFAESYERDLVNREKQLDKKRVELDLHMKRLEETRRVMDTIQSTEAQTLIEQIEQHNTGLEHKYRHWLKFLQKHQLMAFYQDHSIPSPSCSMQELKLFSDQLEQLKAARKQKTERLIELQCRVPPKKYQEYKRLISTCCNVAYENVDLMLGPLLASFEQEQQTMSPIE
ncbi:uncharacterized protein B0P05DRAFT_505496 [Gilbertella persicaria]|uniref:uncharacterized protein n=1 Tax=Gilbertella persicaria TaxID=101096 RepID=UPI00221E9456|nr:uncharacterized protein B0P05DRAFT_505496 [Gilbertella persicaria]KAI8087952.1 hypothetical protein B0P05DRAFT_505496 [Gilbertella persicaria]